MNLTKVILVSAATSAVLIAVLAAIGWGYAQQHLAAAQSGLLQAHHLRGMWFSAPGWRGHGGCARFDADHVERHTALADRWLVEELDLDAAQQAALAPVLGEASAWMVGLRDLCESESDNARETLALLSDLTGRSDTAVKSMLTAFDGFYRSLDGGQRETVDGWLRWPHRHGVE